MKDSVYKTRLYTLLECVCVYFTSELLKASALLSSIPITKSDYKLS